MITTNNMMSNTIAANLTKLGNQLIQSNQRLASAKRINTGSDDPAGLIALENLQASIAELDAAAKNGQRINSIIDTADGAMSEISSLLNTIESNTVAAAGNTISPEERAAYQAEIDSAISSIDRIVSTTNFNGINLLDGQLASGSTGGADWQLNADPAGRIEFSQTSLSSANLGSESLGFLSSLKSGGGNSLTTANQSTADGIVSAAVNQVATARAQMGAVQSNTINSTLNSFADAKTALTNAASNIGDLDYANEVANNNRLGLLLNTSIATTAMANQNSTNVLLLLNR